MAGASAAATAASSPTGESRASTRKICASSVEHDPRPDAAGQRAARRLAERVGGELRGERGERRRARTPTPAARRPGRSGRPPAPARKAASLTACGMRSGTRAPCAMSTNVEPTRAEDDQQRDERRREEQQHRHEHELGRHHDPVAERELDARHRRVDDDEHRRDRQRERPRGLDQHGEQRARRPASRRRTRPRPHARASAVRSSATPGSPRGGVPWRRRCSGRGIIGTKRVSYVVGRPRLPTLGA